MRIFLISVVAASLLALSPISVFSQVTSGAVTETTLASAGTEYSVNLGPGIKSFSVQARGDYDIRIAFSADGTSANYFTIKAGTVYYSPTLFSSPTLYLRSEDDAVVVEIEYWR